MQRAYQVLAAGIVMGFGQAAFAQNVELTFGSYLAGSLRHLDSDFEAGEDRFDGDNNASRVNLKAALSGEQGRVFAFYERGLRNDKAGIEPDRQLYIGVDSAYGTLTAGKKASAFREAGERLDPFYDTAIVGFNARAFTEGASYGLSNLTNAFSQNSVAYTSPVLLGGLQLNAGAFIGSKSAPNDKIDYAAGGAYTLSDAFVEGNALTAGVQYLKIENGTAFALGNSRLNDRAPVGGTPGKSDNIRVHAAYAMPRFTVGVSFEHIDVKAERKARGYFYSAATYALTEATRLAVSYGHLDFKTGSPALSGDGISLGVFQKLTDNVNAYVAGRHVMLDSPGDTTSIAAGLSVNFNGKLVPWE